MLVVDDETALVRALRRTLAAEFEVTVADSGRGGSAILAAADAEYDVILCDLMMPDLSGMDLHDELARTRPELARRMVFMTGGAFTPRARQFLATVGNRRIEKPFEFSQLVTLLRTL